MKNLHLRERIAAFVLTLAMLLSSIPVASVLAIGTEPTICVGDVVAQAGRNVEVPISLMNNPGIVSATIYVSFDESKLTLVDVVDAGHLGEALHGSGRTSPYTLVWANDTVQTDFTYNGTIASLVFKINDTLVDGDSTPITVSYNYDNWDIYNKIPEKVRFSLKNGSITVGKPGPASIGDFEYIINGDEITITGYKGTAKNLIIGSEYEIDGKTYTVTTIDIEAFYESSITSVVIPETIKTVKEAAFYECLSLKDITVLSKDTVIEDVAFGYKASGRKDILIDGVVIKGYKNTTIASYASENGITFEELAEEGGTISVTGISLNKETLSLKTGESETLLPIFSPENATNKGVTWKSDNPSVATVAQNGKVEAVSKGSATITVKTADGDFEAFCAVVVACSHAHTTSHAAEGSTCIKHGHDAYVVCDDCGVIVSGSDAELPLAAHTWVNNADSKFIVSVATCRDQAVYYKSCSVCGGKGTETFVYGEKDPDNHVGDTYLKDQKEATCFEEGYTGDTYCSGCNELISRGTVIGKNAHNPAFVWSHDETHHWKDCQTVGCGNLIDKAEHSGGEATCISKAVCEVCGVQYDTTDPDNHKNTEVRDAVEATCFEEGYTGDTYCKDCGKKIADGKEIPATGLHTDADGKWETNSTQHFHTCECGATFDTANHSGGKATCKDQAVCSICGTSYGEKDPDNHVGDTYLKDQKEATCFEEGYTGDTYCSGCNELISRGTVIGKNAHNPAFVWSHDETHHWKDCQTVGCGNLIDKAAHVYDDDADTDCNICGYERTITPPTLGDLDDDGLITVSDVVLLRQIILTGEWSDRELTAGDLDISGSLTVSDVVALRALILYR